MREQQRFCLSRPESAVDSMPFSGTSFLSDRVKRN
jgi:hypothetical protein